MRRSNSRNRRPASPEIDPAKKKKKRIAKKAGDPRTEIARVSASVSDASLPLRSPGHRPGRSHPSGRGHSLGRVLDRRDFLMGSIATLGLAGAAPAAALARGLGAEGRGTGTAPASPIRPRSEYKGPNVIIVRFGGGARRLETINEQHTWSPYLCHELKKRGTFFPLMGIDSPKGVGVSHGQGTLNILTGLYDRYQDADDKFLGERFEARVPTLFEYLRKEFDIPEHQTLIVNGEDRIDEEFYTFSNHHLFGVDYRSNVLSLHRFKIHLLHRQLEEGFWKDGDIRKKRADLAEMESVDYRVKERGAQAPELQSYWDRWRSYYGTSGLVNPRGDRVITELALRAIRELRPKLMILNYQDCDYVHWGNIHHYTRGVQIMDEGLRSLVAATEADEVYRNNTIFVIVPDCGRDSNPLRAVPCQHHFNTKSAREIFALVMGPGIANGVVVDKPAEQIDIAPTIAALMGFKAEHAQGEVREEVFA